MSSASNGGGAELIRRAGDKAHARARRPAACRGTLTPPQSPNNHPNSLQLTKILGETSSEMAGLFCYVQGLTEEWEPSPVAEPPAKGRSEDRDEYTGGVGDGVACATGTTARSERALKGISAWGH